MNPCDLLRAWVAPAAILAALLCLPAVAEEPTTPADGDKPAVIDGQGQADPTKLLKIEPAKPKALTSPEAQEALDTLRDAYTALKAASMSGKLTADFDIDGKQVNNAAEFTSGFQAPNKFRHEIKNDVLLGSTGEKVYTYRPQINAFLMTDAPKSRASEAMDLPSPIGRILDQQNPSLLLALVTDAAGQLLGGASKADRGADVKIGDVSYTAVNLTTQEGAEVQLLIDPTTHLLRRISIDAIKAAAARGQQDVKQAQIVIDYTEVKTGGAAKLPEFAWAPPEGARDAALASADEPEDAALTLVGEAAPDFTLTGMDGKEVKLSALKGSVVVLDFWATWCPPCVVSLPHLDTLNKEMAPKGVKFYAINLEEEKADVQKFIDETKLSTHVLLDPTGNTMRAYRGPPIPETVVIGKDGKVKKVFVGFYPDKTPQELKEAVEAALK